MPLMPEAVTVRFFRCENTDNQGDYANDAANEDGGEDEANDAENECGKGAVAFWRWWDQDQSCRDSPLSELCWEKVTRNGRNLKFEISSTTGIMLLHGY